MTNHSIQLTDKLYDYLLSVSLRESELMQRLRAETQKFEDSGMQMSPDEAQFLAFIVKAIGARRTLEVGVFTGYSSLAVASALPDDGQHVACDVNETWTSVGRRYWQEAGVDHKITLHLAPAIQTLQRLLDKGQQNSFDFAFIDADKGNYDNYYELCLQLVRPGGLLGLDNMLWHGQVLDESAPDTSTRAIQNLNKKLHTDNRVDLSLIPIGDGVMLLRKR